MGELVPDCTNQPPGLKPSLNCVQPVNDPPPASKLPFTMTFGELSVLMAATAVRATPRWLSNSTHGVATYALRSNATIARSCGAGPVGSASHAASAATASRQIPLIRGRFGNSLYGGTWDHTSTGEGQMSDAATLGIRSMDLGTT